MKQLAMITDIHFGCRGGNITFQEYMEKFIEDFFSEIDKRGVKEVLCLGDFTDSRKATNYQIVKRVNDIFFSQIKSLNLDLSIICGNHDSFYRNTLSINSLSSVFSFDNVDIIVEPTNKPYGLVLPWINEQNQDDCYDSIEKSKERFCYGHFEIENCKMYRHSKSEHGMDPKLFKKFETIFSGHFHHRSQYGNIQYIGAAGYYNWQDYNDDRGWTLFDYENNKQQFFLNEHCIFHREVYNDVDYDMKEIDPSLFEGKVVQVIVEKKEDVGAFNDYIKELQKIDMFDLKIIDETLYTSKKEDSEEISAEAKDVLQLIDEYVDSQEDDSIDGPSVKQLAKDVYKTVA